MVMKFLSSRKIIFFLFLIISLTGCISRNEVGMADNSGTYLHIDQKTAKDMMDRDDGHVIVDVRRRDEYEEGHIPGAILIPNESILATPPDALTDLDQIILVYCRSGNRSRQAAQKLADMGYTNVYEFGGILTWTGETVAGSDPVGNGQPAVLTRSLSVNSKYEYEVVIEHPDLVSCSVVPDDTLQDGDGSEASYGVRITFTGKKPGSTTAVLYGRSPDLKNDVSIYTVLVDNALNVSLTPVRKISVFCIERMIEGGFSSFDITMDKNGYTVMIDRKTEQSFSAEAVDELMNAVDDYHVTDWDGFNRSMPDVLDGEDFWLEIRFTDGTRVTAKGQNDFPDNYSEAMSVIWRILTWNTGD